jgi:hypothetical protein
MWTSVKTEPPKRFNHVLLRGLLHRTNVEGLAVHYEGYLCGDNKTWSDWCGDVDDGVEITHWMPLPAEPVD